MLTKINNIPADDVEVHANGEMVLDTGSDFKHRAIHIVGGPFDSRPKIAGIGFAVCARMERVPKTGVDLLIPIRDFDVPKHTQSELDAALYMIGTAALEGQTVYIGCMGGWGRTGLVMALLIKAFGSDNPVEVVRAHYTAHAVETLPQQEYVANYDTTAVTKALKKYAWKLNFASYFPKFMRPLFGLK